MNGNLEKFSMEQLVNIGLFLRNIKDQQQPIAPLADELKQTFQILPSNTDKTVAGFIDEIELEFQHRMDIMEDDENSEVLSDEDTAYIVMMSIASLDMINK